MLPYIRGRFSQLETAIKTNCLVCEAYCANNGE
jgi:hypothetical protein